MSRLHPVFNVVKLTPAPVEPIQGWHLIPPPPPKIIEGEEEWIVEEILDSRMINRKLKYLIKWEVRLDMVAPAGLPGPYPQVFQALKLIQSYLDL